MLKQVFLSTGFWFEWDLNTIDYNFRTIDIKQT